MDSPLETGVTWFHLLDRKGLKVEYRNGLLHSSVKIYRITKGELREVIGRREAPVVLIQALESKKKKITFKVLTLSKSEVLAAAQAILKDITGRTSDLIGGAREALQILRGLEGKNEEKKDIKKD